MLAIAFGCVALQFGTSDAKFELEDHPILLLTIQATIVLGMAAAIVICGIWAGRWVALEGLSS